MMMLTIRNIIKFRVQNRRSSLDLATDHLVDQGRISSDKESIGVFVSTLVRTMEDAFVAPKVASASKDDRVLQRKKE